jgi:hypothetical protein
MTNACGWRASTKDSGPALTLRHAGTWQAPKAAATDVLCRPAACNPPLADSAESMICHRTNTWAFPPCSHSVAATTVQTGFVVDWTTVLAGFARISIHVLEYPLTLSRPCRRSQCSLSIILVGKSGRRLRAACSHVGGAGVPAQIIRVRVSQTSVVGCSGVS